MLLLAYLLRTDIDWRDATIYLKLVVPHKVAAQSAQANLDQWLKRLRLGVLSQVLVAEGQPFEQILHQSSEDADLIFLGMATPGENFTHYYEKLQFLVNGLPTTIFVLATASFAFGEVLDNR